MPAASIASSPSATTSTCTGNPFSGCSATSWLVGLSSANSIRSGRPSAATRARNTRAASVAMGAAAGARVASGRVSVTAKVLPWLGTDRTTIWPPIWSTSRLLMASPRPEPPNRRVIVLSACTNSSNRRSIRSAGMPMPVSLTVQVTVARVSSRATQRASIRTLPDAVNFTAFETRFSSTCRMRPASPSSAGGTSSAQIASMVSPLAAARGPRMLTGLCVTSWGENGAASSVMRPASSLEKSRMSFSSRSRLSPDSRIALTTERCCGGSGASSSVPARPSTAFIGVRISWLIIARKPDRWRLSASASRSR